MRKPHQQAPDQNIWDNIRYLAPIETLAGYHRLRRYVRRHRVSPEKVLVVCMRDDLAALLTSQSSSFHIIGRRGIPSLEDAVTAANEEAAQLGNEWMPVMEQSDFLWAIAWQFQAEYLLHLRATMRAAEALLDSMPADTMCLLTSGGWVWGSGADQFGDRNPLWYLALKNQLEIRGRPYLEVGLHRVGMLFAVARIRFGVNVVGFVFVSLFNRFFGLVQGALGTTHSRDGILAFFHEPLQFAQVSELLAVLRNKNISLHRVAYANLFRVRPQALFSDVYTLYRNILSLILPAHSISTIGRIDQRIRSSSWLYIHLEGIQHVGFRDYQQLWHGMRRQMAELWRLLDTYPWHRDKKYAILASYTRLVILNYAVEYMFSAVSLLSLLRQTQPRLVVYPDGYNMLVRLAQVWDTKHGYITAQVPHGYPNRTFPGYYYHAQHFIIPSRASDIQLRRIGHDSSLMHWVEQPIRSTSPPLRPVDSKIFTVGVVYTGSYAYWSFPNLYAELFEVTCELLRALKTALPTARVVLKSHPNGTSPYFFAAVLNAFVEDVQKGSITHVSQGWSKPKEWQQLSAVVAPLIFPSTPTMQFLTSGIPLLYIPGEYRVPPVNMYYPHQQAMPQYPFIMADTEDTTALSRLASDKNFYEQARGAAIKYAEESSLPPAGVPSEALAQIYATLTHQSSR